MALLLQNAQTATTIHANVHKFFQDKLVVHDAQDLFSQHLQVVFLDAQVVAEIIDALDVYFNKYHKYKYYNKIYLIIFYYKT
jgi:hypothetical protein